MFKSKRPRILAAAGACAVLAASLLAGCGSGEPAAQAGSQQGSGAGSSASQQVSGDMTLYTSEPEEDIQKLIEAFNKVYPDVNVNVYRSGTEEVISKLEAERQAGATQADVLLAADAATFETLKGEDALEAYESPELAGIDKAFYDADHTYAGTKVIATGIMYNTDTVKTAPASFADLAKAAYKDQVDMPSPLYSGAAAYNAGVFSRTDGLGWDWYRALKANGAIAEKGNGTVQKSVVSGQRGAGIIVDYMAIRSKNEGSPVDFVYPSEGSPIITEPVGIIKGAKNEAAAKAFVDFVLSEAGQKATAEIGYTPIRSGVEAPKGLKSVDELKILDGDLSTLVKSREADKAQFSKIFG